MFRKYTTVTTYTYAFICFPLRAICPDNVIIFWLNILRVFGDSFDRRYRHCHLSRAKKPTTSRKLDILLSGSTLTLSNVSAALGANFFPHQLKTDADPSPETLWLFS